MLKHILILITLFLHSILVSNSNSSQIVPSLSEIILQSSKNLTPRGLETPLSQSELNNNVGVVDSLFLLS